MVFEILESNASTINKEYIDSETAGWLRENFNIRHAEFTVTLVGKDGGIKLNRTDQTQLDDIFALIDAMPMRQQEMRQKK